MSSNNLKEKFEQAIKDASPKELPRGPGKVAWHDENNQGAKKVLKPGRPKPDGPPAPKKNMSDLP
jgi:hypothetical protein